MRRPSGIIVDLLLSLVTALTAGLFAVANSQSLHRLPAATVWIVDPFVGRIAVVGSTGRMAFAARASGRCARTPTDRTGCGQEQH